MPIIIKNESEESASNKSTLAVIATLVGVMVVFAVVYFAWYAPSQAAPVVIDHQTVVHDQGTPPPSTTTIIQGQPGATGATGAQGAQGTQGSKGNQGNQGDQGNQGNQGAAGSNADSGNANNVP